MRQRTGRRTKERPNLQGVIGLIVLGVLVLAVYISYTANNGVPFASSYTVNADVPNADHLISTDEVRIGGVRVGQVASVTAVPARHGAAPYARIALKLDPSVGRLPVDTTVTVQTASVLGATYVALQPGSSTRTVSGGGTLPLRNARRTVELTDLLDIFNRPTATGIQNTFAELGTGVAGRGQALNATTASVAQLLGPLANVSRTLAAPATELAGFIHSYDQFVAALAPVSPAFAGVFQGGASTFGALSAVRPALAATIDTLPQAERATTAALDQVNPALDRLASLATELLPAGAVLPSAVRSIDTTASAGLPPLRELPSFDAPLMTAFGALRTVSTAPSTGGAVRKLTDTLDSLNVTLSALTPAQLQCDVIGVFGQNFGSAGYVTDDGRLRANVVITNLGADGDELQNARPSPNLHINYLPNENSQECESGNEPYSPTQQLLANPPGLQSNHTRPTVPPPGVTALARRAGLLKDLGGTS